MAAGAIPPLTAAPAAPVPDWARAGIAELGRIDPDFAGIEAAGFSAQTGA